jgi:formylglycine-generating enzyme required for sulfatase activity
MYARWLVDLGANGSGNDGDEMTINGIECVLVKAGKFIMGGSYFGNSETQQVTLTKDFCISKYPITNAQYGNSNSNANHPVVNVNWSQADTWAKSKGGQLPTEAQWEFAARGGNKSEGYIYSGSNTIGDVAWYSGNNSPNGTKAVGQKLPNELGIYDMSGNVWEWCSDWYGGYSSSAVTDPTGPSTGGNRV